MKNINDYVTKKIDIYDKVTPNNEISVQLHASVH